MNNSQISVITTTYNSSKHILKLIESLKLEKSLIKEIIILENNSPESIITEKLIAKYKKDRTIFFIKNRDNLGFAKSCNKGAKIAKGSYILFINPDVEIKKNSIHTLYYHALHTQADLIGGKVNKYTKGKHNTVVRKPTARIGLLEFSNLGKLLGTQAGHREFYYLDNNHIYNAKNDVVVDGLGGAYLMAKKTSFNKLGGFDERFFMYLEDVDLGVRANIMKMKVVYCPHSIVVHEGGASSKNKYKVRHEAWYDSRKKYYKKHFGLLVNLIIQPIFIIEEFLLKILRPA